MASAFLECDFLNGENKAGTQEQRIQGQRVEVQ